MGGENPEEADASISERVRRIVHHAEESARCYVELLVKRVERAAANIAGQAVRLLILALLALLGAGLFLVGVARFIDYKSGVPGAGSMACGAAIVLAVVVYFMLRDDPKGE